MNDYIKREDLLKQIDIDSKGNEGQYGDEWLFLKTIKSVPSADVVEVRHSVWRVRLAIPEKEYECMKCKKAVWWKYLYCPNCGARMDGDSDE